MTIKKMLLLASMALAAIAFAAPAAAQANVVLTDAQGVPLDEGDPVTATSTNLITTVVGGPILECGHVVLHYEVATNGSQHVVLNPVSNGTETDPSTELHNATVNGCVTNVHAFGIGTHPNNISHAGAGQLTIDTAGTGEAAATFTSNTPTLGSHCSYTGNIPVQATNTTDVLHVETGNTLHDAGGQCQNGEMHGDFTVTSNGAPVEIHFTG